MGRGIGIVLGLLVGGLLGALTRPAVVYAYWLRDAGGELSQALLFTSAAIGLLVGVFAVLVGALFRDAFSASVVAACSGAALAYLFTILTFLPLLFCGLLGIDGVQAVDDEAPLYGIAMALTGAVSGGCGTLLLGWLCAERRPGAGSPP